MIAPIRKIEWFTKIIKLNLESLLIHINGIESSPIVLKIMKVTNLLDINQVISKPMDHFQILSQILQIISGKQVKFTALQINI